MPKPIDEQFERRFRCPKCDKKKAKAERVALTGAGLSKLLDIQHRKYLAVSCLTCGFTEWYDLKVLEGTSRGMDILDVILDE